MPNTLVSTGDRAVNKRLTKLWACHIHITVNLESWELAFLHCRIHHQLQITPRLTNVQRNMVPGAHHTEKSAGKFLEKINKWVQIFSEKLYEKYTSCPQNTEATTVNV